MTDEIDLTQKHDSTLVTEKPHKLSDVSTQKEPEQGKQEVRNVLETNLEAEGEEDEVTTDEPVNSLPKFQPPSLTPNEKLPSETWIQQSRLERTLLTHSRLHSPSSNLLRTAHINYLLSIFTLPSQSTTHVPAVTSAPLPSVYSKLYHASQPWLCYWSLHALDLLSAVPLSTEFLESVLDFLDTCFDGKNGGYGGGPGQIAHLAPTYAAIMSICIISKYQLRLGKETSDEDRNSSNDEVDRTKIGYKRIPRRRLLEFLWNMKKKGRGRFSVSVDGEEDVRGLYCAIAVGRILGLKEDDELWEGCREYIAELQGFDGGFGGEVGNEAHGGYTYCGVACMRLLGMLGGDEQLLKEERTKGRGKGKVDIGLLREWCAMRQMRFSGGFQGRCNKLVDSCYSFWVGAACEMVGVDFDGERLMEYLLRFSQMNEDDSERTTDKIGKRGKGEKQIGGGWRDKPGVQKDFYHSCYALSGFSAAQHWGGASVGEHMNGLKKMNAAYGLCEDSAELALDYFCEYNGQQGE